jgi:hypothetical protein
MHLICRTDARAHVQQTTTTRFAHSIVKCSFVDGVRNKKMQKNKVSYNIAGGKFYTKYEAKPGISLPEFSQTNVV